MQELMAILVSKRESDYENRKFFAALKGINLDEQSGQSKGQKEWEDMKAKVFSGGKTTNSNDVISLQGVSAQKAGFGVGMGLDYHTVKDSKNPMA
jgi:hypothetical protein